MNNCKKWYRIFDESSEIILGILHVAHLTEIFKTKCCGPSPLFKIAFPESPWMAICAANSLDSNIFSGIIHLSTRTPWKNSFLSPETQGVMQIIDLVNDVPFVCFLVADIQSLDCWLPRPALSTLPRIEQVLHESRTYKRMKWISWITENEKFYFRMSALITIPTAIESSSFDRLHPAKCFA